MDQNSSLALNSLSQNNKNALETLLAAYSNPSQRMLLKEMYLTAVNAKVELDEHLNQEFLREFEKQPPAAIEYAFRTWRNGTAFLPAVHEIRELLSSWHEQQAINRGTQYVQELREEKARRIAAGEKMFGWEDVLDAINKMVDSKELTPERKAELRTRVEELTNSKRTA